MRLFPSAALVSLALLSASFLGPFVAAVDINALYVSDDHKTITFDSGVRIELVTADKQFYKKLSETQAAIEIPITADLVASYTISFPNGCKTTISQGNPAQPGGHSMSLKTDCDPNVPAKPTPKTLANAPTHAANALTLNLKPAKGSTAVENVVIGGVTQDPSTLQFYAGNNLSLNGGNLAPGTYEITGKNVMQQYYVLVKLQGGVTVVQLVIKPFIRNKYVVYAEQYALKPGIFLVLFGTLSALSAVLVRSLDPQVYALGDGFFGALGRKGDGDNDVVDFSGGDASADTDNFGPGERTKATQPSRGSPKPDSSEVSSATTNSETADTPNTDGQAGEDVAEKSDARSAAFLAASIGILALLL